jgi:glycosyltransferase involved in cell wall biosynthesis
MVIDIDMFAKPELEVLNSLTKIDYEIYYISGHAQKKADLKNPNVHLFSFPLGKTNFPLKYHVFFLFFQLFYLPIAILKVHPDFVIVDWDSLYGLLPMIPTCKLIGAKVVLDIRSTPTPIQQSDKVDLRNYLMGIVFRASVLIAKRSLNGITIITSLMGKELAKSCGVSTEIGVWTSGVSTQHFSKDKNKKNRVEIRKRFNIEDKFVVFYHGTLSRSRGIFATIDAIELLKTDYQAQVVLFLLGSGPKETLTEIRQAIDNKSLKDNVILHSPVDYQQVPNYISISDLGIVPLFDLPQWRSQCPLKLLEYLSMQKVTIVSDIPCHRELIANSACGIYLNEVSPIGIAEAITYAFNNKEKLEKWGEEGHKIVINNYTWRKIAESIDQYLRYIGAN